MNEPAAPPDPATGGLARRLFGNLSAQAATFGLSATLGTTTTVVLARWLGPEGFGGFKFLFAFIYFFQILNDLGINTTLIREISREPGRTRALVQHTLGLKLLLSAISLVAAWAAAAWWPGLTPEVRWSVAIFALILPIQAMTLPVVTLQARVMVAKASLVEIVSRLTGFIGMMVAVLLGHGLVAVTGALVIGELGGLIVVMMLTRATSCPLRRSTSRPGRKSSGSVCRWE
jgi:O-antigen/teichoic acid export membrane protein